MTDSSLVAAVRAAATPAAAESVQTIPLAQHETAVAAARAEGVTAGRVEGAKEGAAAERTRIAAILDHESAKGRETLARHFAFKTEMKAEDAQAALSAAPKEAEDKGLLAEMKSIKQPAVGGNGGKSESAVSDYDKGAAEAKRLLGLA